MIRIVLAVVVVVQLVAHGTNFSFPFRTVSVCGWWGSTTAHLRRPARLRSLTMRLLCGLLEPECNPQMRSNAAFTQSNPLHMQAPI